MPMHLGSLKLRVVTAETEVQIPSGRHTDYDIRKFRVLFHRKYRNCNV